MASGDAKGFATTGISSSAAAGAKWNAGTKTGANYETDMLTVISSRTDRTDKQYGPISGFVHPTAGVPACQVSFSSNYAKTSVSDCSKASVRLAVSTGVQHCFDVRISLQHDAEHGADGAAHQSHEGDVSWLDPSGFHKRYVRVYAKAAPAYSFRMPERQDWRVHPSRDRTTWTAPRPSPGG